MATATPMVMPVERLVVAVGATSSTRKRSAHDAGCDRSSDHASSKRPRLASVVEENQPSSSLRLVCSNAAENPDLDGHQVDPISALPIELFWHILTFAGPDLHFGRVALVSKHWHNVLASPSLWIRLHKRWFGGKSPTPETAEERCRTATKEYLQLRDSECRERHSKLWFWAAQRGYARVLTELAERGFVVDSQNSESRSALYIACMEGHTEVVRTLLRLGASVDLTRFNGATALHSASWNGHCEAVEALLAGGANVNATHNTGSNALHSASWKGHLDVTRRLIEAKIDVNAQRLDGVVPLHEAAWQGETAVVRLLLASNANPNARRHDGMTPLCAAAQRAHSDIVRMLLAAQADVNLANDNGITPLHSACNSSSVHVIQLLLAAGANLSALALVCGRMQSPYELACGRQIPAPEIVSYLEDAISKQKAQST